MSKGKAPDPRRKKNCQPHATYLRVANGAKEGGYKAGELYGCYGHRTHAIQPCVSDITETALQCPYCASGMVAEWRGYVPVWDRDFTLRYVLVNEEYYVSVDAIAIGAQVMMSRGKNPISPLVMRDETVFTRKLPDCAPFNKPVDMLAICLLLWKNEPLNKWFAAKQAQESAAQVVKDTTPPELRPALGPLERLRAAEQKHKEEQTAQEELAAAVVNRILTPSTNGKHPFKKPK